MTLRSSNKSAAVYGEDLTFALPPSWTGRGRLGNSATNVTWSDLELIHATTAPRLRPTWVNLSDALDRATGELSDSFDATVQIHRRSTGGLHLVSYWNEFWDETTPLLFVPAKILLHLADGKVSEVRIMDFGDGYGTEARFRFSSKLSDLPNNNGLQLPELTAVIEKGKLTRVIIQSPGIRLPNDLTVEVLRRPPLSQIAIGKAAVTAGTVTGVEILRGGGFYANPPLVVFHDLQGDGYDASGYAILDQNGAVAEIRITKGGSNYSNDVVVAFYTHSKDLAEFVVPPPDDPTSDERYAEVNSQDFPEDWSFQFSQVFSDTTARQVVYVAEASSRFREILKDQKDLPVPVRPRLSKPRRIGIAATNRPPDPEWRNHSYSFLWNPGNIKQQGLLKLPPSNRLVINRDTAIRCYLRRGWNASGPEYLGVVVCQSEANTVKLSDDTDKGGIPTALRSLVSRWGYDPVWDDAAVPGVSMDDLTTQRDFVPYERLIELGDSAPKLVGVALFDVQYDDDLQLWYADIGLRTPPEIMPFVQLALVRYQPTALPGLSLSQVTMTDPIRVPGSRLLTVVRTNAFKFDITLSGSFRFDPEEQKDPDKLTAPVLPRRAAVVELRRRSTSCAPEIEGPLANDPTDIAFTSRMLAGADDAASRPDRLLLRLGKGSFSGSFEFNPPPLGENEKYYIRIVESEIYPTSEPQRDQTGQSAHFLNAKSTDPAAPNPVQRNTAQWTPFTCGILLS